MFLIDQAVSISPHLQQANRTLKSKVSGRSGKLCTRSTIILI